MFEIGWSELGIIALIALIVLGPEEFIVVARKTGRMIGGLKRMASDWQSQLEEALPKDEILDNQMRAIEPPPKPDRIHDVDQQR